MTVDNVKNEINLSFPNLRLEKVDYFNEGMDSTVFLINDVYIFRFAKQVKTSGLGGGLENEIKLLPLLQTSLKVSIPSFEFSGVQTTGLPFVGYKKIPGEELSVSLLNSVEENLRINIFEVISDFFQTIHSFPIDISQKCGVKLVDFQDQYYQDGESFKESPSFSLLTELEQKYILGMLHKYLEEPENFTYTPSLLHADLWLSHILFEKKLNKITGIIDFGDMIIGDPDYDFMHIHQDYGDQSLDYFSNLIPNFNKERVKRKAVFFQQWNIVQDLLFFQKNNDQKAIEESLSDIKSFSDILKL